MIIKVRTKKPRYVRVDTGILEDSTISWSAKGFLLYLATLPKGAEVDIEYACSLTFCRGTGRFHEMVKELEDAGFLEARVERKENGGVVITGFKLMSDTIVDKGDGEEIP